MVAAGVLHRVHGVCVRHYRMGVVNMAIDMKVKLTRICKINDSVSALKQEVMNDFECYNVSEYWCIMAYLDDVSDILRKVFNVERGAENPTMDDWTMKNGF